MSPLDWIWIAHQIGLPPSRSTSNAFAVPANLKTYQNQRHTQMKNTSLGSIVNSALPWMVSKRSSVNPTWQISHFSIFSIGGLNRSTRLTVQVATILKSNLLVVSFQLGTQSTYAKSLNKNTTLRWDEFLFVWAPEDGPPLCNHFQQPE